MYEDISNIYGEGFITGKKTQYISWGSLAMDPSSWIDKECTPDGFEWKDPSKIKIGEIFRLLDHWRDRIDRGLHGLVWVPSCPLFKDVDHAPIHQRRLRQQIPLPEDYSDEEVFVLPQSDDIEEYQSNSDDYKSSHRSSSVHDPFEEEVMDASASGASRPLESSSCEYCIPFTDLINLICVISPLDVREQSPMPTSNPHISSSGKPLITSWICNQFTSNNLQTLLDHLGLNIAHRLGSMPFKGLTQRKESGTLRFQRNQRKKLYL